PKPLHINTNVADSSSYSIVALSMNPPSTPAPTKTRNQQAKELFDRGLQYHCLHQYERAVKCFEEAAEVNYPPALLFMGIHYYEGYGIPKNQKKATEYSKKLHEKLSWFGRDEISEISRKYYFAR